MRLGGIRPRAFRPFILRQGLALFACPVTKEVMCSLEIRQRLDRCQREISLSNDATSSPHPSVRPSSVHFLMALLSAVLNRLLLCDYENFSLLKKEKNLWPEEEEERSDTPDNTETEQGNTSQRVAPTLTLIARILSLPRSEGWLVGCPFPGRLPGYCKFVRSNQCHARRCDGCDRKTPV